MTVRGLTLYTFQFLSPSGPPPTSFFAKLCHRWASAGGPIRTYDLPSLAWPNWAMGKSDSISNEFALRFGSVHVSINGLFLIWCCLFSPNGLFFNSADNSPSANCVIFPLQRQEETCLITGNRPTRFIWELAFYFPPHAPICIG